MAKNNNGVDDGLDKINNVGEGKPDERVELPKFNQQTQARDSQPVDQPTQQTDQKSNFVADKLKSMATGKITDKTNNVATKYNRWRDRTKKLVSGFTRIGGFLVALLTNPVTWVIGAITIVMLVMLSGFNTIGTSDYGKNCATPEDVEEAISNEGTGGADAWTKKGTNDYKNAKKVWDLWAKRGFSGAAIAGIMGNIANEGGFAIPDRAQGCNSGGEAECGISTGHAGSGGGGGLYQFTPLTKYAPVGDKRWLDIEGQTNAVWKLEVGSMLDHCPYNVFGHGVGSYRAFAKLDDPKKAAAAWMSMYERPGADNAGVREASAEEAYKAFGGSSVKYDESKLGKGDSSSSGSSGSDSSDSSDAATCVTDGDDPAATSDILKFALSIAWPKAQASKGNVNCGSLAGCGKAQATPAYIKAKEKAEKNGKDPITDLYASCDRFVATVVRNTVDKNYPWGATGEQLNYVNKHTDKWQKIDCKNVKAGDVILAVTRSGANDNHTMIYDTPDVIVSASYMDRTGTEHNGYKIGCSGGLLTKVDGHDYGQAYRHKGTADPVK